MNRRAILANRAVGPDELFGHVNDSIRGLAHQGPLDETWEFICECPDAGCHEMVSLTLVEFDERRAASPPAPILAEHEDDPSRVSTGKETRDELGRQD